MRKRIIYVIIIVVLLLTGCTIGGSLSDPGCQDIV
mgnify:CR=1 FL=1